ncbi:Acyl-phosphate:glycerol-3-phosphate O-acyltransferase PlsY [Thioalkalivibrio nitratireducens DSM 14787]|uniref:Glycerol-3-phosphate acyltransferase n=1 Tax=Thioalkalivibrio nitratireducens (strain DSM 14787 / UNIQEM 213 / ALEN2) TaxID=1255043 RepID=L0DSF5_THIND|nr:glycerol-3-phosphate 1-O-acyltransferase PlsY [Thioalkalivibrio nitratireducens]AGA31900.1 Acyl-phosphate:glycerol-3-phosphate O-acyltransferase PlsY [Thioalkalivibrio nitratireducens DSM 14787]
MDIAVLIIGMLLAYLLGSISSAIVVSRLLGLPDPRATGSGNPGATNVLRAGSKTGAALTLAGDAAKGWLPVFIALQSVHFPAWMVGLIALAAFLGHLYPVFFGFRGGKGVATALGVILAIHPLTGLLVLATWLLVAVIVRYSSLAALVAALAAPIYLALWHPEPWLIAAVGVMVLFLYLRHSTNIQRLLQGTEPRIGEKKPAANRGD